MRKGSLTRRLVRRLAQRLADEERHLLDTVPWGSLNVARRILRIWRGFSARRDSVRGSGRSCVDFDIGDRVPFDMVRTQTVARRGEEDYAGRKFVALDRQL